MRTPPRGGEGHRLGLAEAAAEIVFEPETGASGASLVARKRAPAALVPRLGGGLGGLQVAHAEAPHRLAGQELDHADQHGEARIVFDRVLRHRIHGRGRVLGRERALARGGDLHRRALRASRCGTGVRCAAPDFEALAGLERLGETVRGLEFDTEGGDFHGEGIENVTERYT